MKPEHAEALRRSAAHVLVGDVAAPALDDDATHHVFRVLRLRDGESLTVTDGAGSWRPCRAVVPTGGAGGVEPDGDPVFAPRRPAAVTIAFAIPKHDRPEWIVQKLTELGVDRIVLLHAGRSVVRWGPDRAARHVAKLERVAAEALQQSRGVWLPEITGPEAAAAVLPDAVAAEPGGRPLAAGDRTIAIGPEGGWTPAELVLAVDRVAIAPTVLRVETAALAAATLAITHAVTHAA